MNKPLVIIIFTVLALLCSCNDFLSEKPNKSSALIPTDVEQLDYIFNSYSNFCLESNRTLICSSDATGLLTELTDALPGIPGLSMVEFSVWDIENLPTDNREGFFSGEYNKIFRANMVLSYLPQVNGDEESKSRLEKEAKFIRAYSLWNLAQTYCLPYTESNKDEMGMTIKSSTSFDEFAGRATLKETYEAIESDLADALKITTDMKVINKKYSHWRANKAAVNGFAARYWLNRNDYAKAYQYATVALESHSILVDYNTEMRYSSIPTIVNVNGQNVEILYPYTHDNQIDYNDRMEWKEMMYFRMLNHSSWWYIPSRELLSLYDHDYDLRYRYHIVDNFSYTRGMNKFEYPGYVFFFKDCIPSGPTTAEMILIRAECLARQNKIGEAISEVNKLREARMDKKGPASARYLYANSKEEAIKVIIDEREREMPFTQRWFDMRRLNNNEDSNDDIGDITRAYYPYNSSTVLTDQPPIKYVLTKDSRRYAAPIPYADIKSSNGVIKQNKY